MIPMTSLDWYCLGLSALCLGLALWVWLDSKTNNTPL